MAINVKAKFIDQEMTTDVELAAETTARVNEDLTFLKLDGSRAMTGNLNLNNFDINSINKKTEKINVTVPTYTAATANGVLTLTNTSTSVHFITGSATGFSVVFPNATTLTLGTNYEIYNRTSSPITLRYSDNSVLGILSPESVSSLCLQDNSTSVGLFSPFSVEVGQASGITNYNASSQTPFATTATNTYQQITDFVVTPAAGKYAIFFDSSCSSTNNNSENYVQIYRDTTPLAESERLAQSVASNFRFQLGTLVIADFDGTQQLRVYVKVSTGVLTVNARTGVVLRLGGVG